jgi:hypothetical protein
MSPSMNLGYVKQGLVGQLKKRKCKLKNHKNSKEGTMKIKNHKQLKNKENKWRLI